MKSDDSYHEEVMDRGNTIYPRQYGQSVIVEGFVPFDDEITLHARATLGLPITKITQHAPQIVTMKAVANRPYSSFYSSRKQQYFQSQYSVGSA